MGSQYLIVLRKEEWYFERIKYHIQKRFSSNLQPTMICKKRNWTFWKAEALTDLFPGSAFPEEGTRTADSSSAGKRGRIDSPCSREETLQDH